MLVVVSGSFTLAFGADFTFQISGLGLSKCHSTLTSSIRMMSFPVAICGFGSLWTKASA